MDYRREFADFEGVAYLNCATQGPIPLAAATAAKAALEWKKRPDQIPASAYFEMPDRVRAKFAKIIAADASEVAITAGATSGMTSVASGLDFQAGDEVIVARGEFPAHFATWFPYQKAGRVTLRVVPPRGKFIAPEDYIEQFSARTRLVSASFVRFDNGARLDAARLANACHDKGIPLLLDFSQSAGGIPIDVKSLGADFAVASGYKWLFGPYGTGFFWVSAEWAERLQLGPVNWTAIEGSDNFSALPLDQLKLAKGARRWDAPETGNFTNLTALEASLDLILRIGVEAIAKYNLGLTTELIERLPYDRVALVSPADAEKRGPYVCIVARKPDETPKLFRRLASTEIVAAMRENAIRIAPNIYNTSDHITRVIKSLSL
jgi:selenocysteine lyase/cysteine desulfurase